MRFAETKIKGGYKYWTVDNEVFGKMTFESPVKLNAEQVDLISCHCLNTQQKKGEVMLQRLGKKNIRVKFIFRQKPAWGTKEKTKINLSKKDE